MFTVHRVGVKETVCGIKCEGWKSQCAGGTRSQEPALEYVAFAIDEIIANFSNPNYNFSETQAKIPMNEDYFRRLFEKETGYTPLQRLSLARIEHAKRLLHLRSRSGLSIQEIAWMCGFRDSLYFSRIFRRTTGTAPKDWI